jgi:hypothetical protein
MPNLGQYSKRSSCFARSIASCYYVENLWHFSFALQKTRKGTKIFWIKQVILKKNKSKGCKYQQKVLPLPPKSKRTHIKTNEYEENNHYFCVPHVHDYAAGRGASDVSLSAYRWRVEDRRQDGQEVGVHGHED